MTDSNPYRQPAEPSKSPDQSENNELDDASAATPGGIKLIACFYFLLSLGSLVAAMMVVEGRVLLFLTAAACIAAGVGLWRGAKWSWWIAIFYHCWFGIWDKLESVSGLRGEDVAASINAADSCLCFSCILWPSTTCWDPKRGNILERKESLPGSRCC